MAVSVRACEGGRDSHAARTLAEATRVIFIRICCWSAVVMDSSCANPRGQGVLQRRIVLISGRAHSLPGQPN